ncbi:DNA translocase FtsK [Xenorhabdus sp. PB62.4]|uniref:DNA translocase FtsK n=1 Tax=Xenorhabdus sp. PB62.4 TaxID=1851573 RepID=UPI001656D71C|nr:DNA translocase FtsK [Xenorhabdus sp. PB62.4]MBC8954544.1 cell division protein FtsK [Xenorhabdus sp. PB62.4]
MKSKSLGLDPLYWQAVDFVIRKDYASIEEIQRELDIEWQRANRLINELELTGVISGSDYDGKLIR